MGGRGVPLFVLALLLQAATSIKVERVVVPSIVEAGSNVLLECLYEEDGDKLYSLKWWRGDDQFYQYVPPSRHAFPVSGVAVNLTATNALNSRSNGQEIVLLERVGLDTAGVFKCEVMADTSFQTEFREANMTVIYVPDGPPSITGAHGTHLHNISVGQTASLRCASPPASPPPALTWLINGRQVNGSWISAESPVFQRNLARVSSRLRFTVQESMVLGEREVRVTCSAAQDMHAPHLQPQSITVTLHLAPQPTLWERIFSRSCGTPMLSVSRRHHHLLSLLPLLLLLLLAC
ncbi:uncharacterized protein LOC126983681 [Eriocheir sinensis]|uniref:uncharacterized protein LOC126983681 n=1 Tax=Eriocheir sinensis TaxID=95602 RepID=UPI0021C640B5|nr:uncharacterized protein LOC126983681 [Eriocheir sinensis]